MSELNENSVQSAIAVETPRQPWNAPVVRKTLARSAETAIFTIVDGDTVS